MSWFILLAQYLIIHVCVIVARFANNVSKQIIINTVGKIANFRLVISMYGIHTHYIAKSDIIYVYKFNDYLQINMLMHSSTFSAQLIKYVPRVSKSDNNLRVCKVDYYTMYILMYERCMHVYLYTCTPLGTLLISNLMLYPGALVFQT